MRDFIIEFTGNFSEILTAIGQHVMLSITALIAGILVAVPVGIMLARNKRAASVVLGIFGVVNTIPSIVLLGAAMMVLGLGFKPAVAVLFLYCLLPIMRGTCTGISQVSPKYIKAALGTGMSRINMLLLVQLPLATPSIITGIRLSSIYVISWATLATFIGAGGLGDIIWRGLQTYNFSLVLCGAIPATILSLTVSILLNQVIAMARRYTREGATAK